MTALTSTDPEPAGDIEAQLLALIDPAHPKRAVWVSTGTPAHPLQTFALADGFCRLALPAGTLIASEHDCGRLADCPTEEMLAALLDYIETKSAVVTRPAVWWPVVQACDAEEHVVWEQLASWSRLSEAFARARQYGRLRILTMGEVLQRRQRLIAEEDGSCQKAPRSPRLKAN